MSIVIISPNRNIEPWINSLKKVEPKIDIQIFGKDNNQGESDFALSWNHPIGAFSNYPNLKCISSMGAGVDHLLNDPDLPKNITITRIVDPELSQSMFEFILSLIMNHLRGLTGYKIEQSYTIWEPKPYIRMKDVNIGIMGIGAIGTHSALQLNKLGFKVSGWASSKKEIKDVTVFYGDKQLPDFLKDSHILICLLPLTKETQGILNEATFRLLPKNAFVINVARGQHLVDLDLIELIDNGHLSGASLDVFSDEPLAKEHPFWKHPKINITPHIASLTNPNSVAPQIIENYKRMKENRPLLNVVSRNKGY